METSDESSRSAVDVSLYGKIDDALSALDTAFCSLVSAGLALGDDEVADHAEEDGVVVYAKEIGVQASAALQAISRLKQTAVQNDWKTLEENRKAIKQRYEVQVENVVKRLNKLKQETRNLLRSTEDHFLEYPVRFRDSSN